METIDLHVVQRLSGGSLSVMPEHLLYSMQKKSAESSPISGLFIFVVTVADADAV